MKTIEIDIGMRLRKVRLSHEYTQEQVGDGIGIPRSRYGSYEENRAEPCVRTLHCLVQFYGYKTIEQLLGIEKKKGSVSPILEKYHSLTRDKKKIVDFILGI